MMRTHTCADLTAKDLGKKVKLCGWAHTRRDHGGIIFIDLRDRYGLSQIVFDPANNKKNHSEAEHIGREWVLQIEGKVRRRPKNMENSKMITGEIEVLVDNLNVLSKSNIPPFEIEDRIDPSEEVRLKYRYLDLRRPIIQSRILKRAKIAKAVREYLTTHEFIEIETPLLVKSTPEGARDYLVPSRVNFGKFYALPQSPQLYKQILMVAGFDKYFQIARCLRDEDLRTDRQPEHSQIDLEMSFVEPEDVMKLVEGLYAYMFKTVLGIRISTPIKKINYDEAMEKYGSDKPDLRYGLYIIDITEEIKNTTFNVFKKAESVKCIYVNKDFTRKETDSLIDWAQLHGSKGLAWAKVEGNKLESSIVKFIPAKTQKKIINKLKAKTGYVFFIADSQKKAPILMGLIRSEIARRKDLIDDKKFEFCWITDFPMFQQNEEADEWIPNHHIFTRPTKETEKFIENEPEKVKGMLYDLVLNGVELGSGSIRITDSKLQQKVLARIGISSEEAQQKFGFLLDSFKYGAPPMGGIGLGFDRTVALMQGLHDIREVIAFPKNKKAENPMDGSPSKVDSKQLKELNLKQIK